MNIAAQESNHIFCIKKAVLKSRKQNNYVALEQYQEKEELRLFLRFYFDMINDK